MRFFVFDTLAYAETLKAGGFSQQQAETLARTMAELFERQRAAEQVNVEVRATDSDPDIDRLRLEIRRAVAESRAASLPWIVVGMAVVQVALFVAMLAALKCLG